MTDKLRVKLVLYFQEPFIPLGWLILVLFILFEVIYLYDKKLPKRNQSRFWFAAYRNIFALLKVPLLIAVLGIINIIKKVVPITINNIDLILKWVGYVGLAILGIAALALFIYLNSFKYKVRAER